MTITELFLIAVGLSMDAFAVAVGKGMAMRRIYLKQSLIVGLYFGIFQAIMPLLGYIVGIQFAEAIRSIDHWVAFGLLGFIGIKMIGDSLHSQDSPGPPRNNPEQQALSAGKMLPLAVATSIDALAVGVSFAFLQVRIVPAITCIGLTTLLLSMAGVAIGHAFGSKLKARAGLAGGIILILIGLKILLEHLEIISF